MIGLAPSNPGLQELNNQLRYGQYHLPMGVDDLASLQCGTIMKEVLIPVFQCQGQFVINFTVYDTWLLCDKAYL